MESHLHIAQVRKWHRCGVRSLSSFCFLDALSEVVMSGNDENGSSLETFEWLHLSFLRILVCICLVVDVISVDLWTHLKEFAHHFHNNRHQISIMTRFLTLILESFENFFHADVIVTFLRVLLYVMLCPGCL